MISVFAVNATVFKKNGDAILCPTEATVRMVAGGEYSMSMEHPIDPWGKWKYLVREAIIKMPVPAETIPAATVGYDTDVYMTTAAASLREGPSEPTTITYQTWSVEAEYAVGTKVTWQNKTINAIITMKPAHMLTLRRRAAAGGRRSPGRPPDRRRSRH